MLDRKQEANGKVRVPVLLTLNGREIIGGDDHIVMESDEPLYPYIRLSHGCSVVAKVRVKETPCKSCRSNGVLQGRVLYFLEI